MRDPGSELDWNRRAHPAAALYRIVLAQPVLILALWTRAWTDWSWILLTVAAAVLWRLAPRLTPPAAPTEDSWATQATRGERLWREGGFAVESRNLNRLSMVAGAAFGAGLVGAVLLVRPLAVMGAAVAVLANLWLADRLAALFRRAG